MKTSWRNIAGGVVSVLVLTACAGLRTVDTDVTAFSQWKNAPPGPNTAYRFERLPSQQLPQEQQDAVELAARAALAKVGMELNPAAPRYAVQVVTSSQPVSDGYSGFSGPGVFLGGDRGGGGRRRRGAVVTPEGLRWLLWLQTSTTSGANVIFSGLAHKRLVKRHEPLLIRAQRQMQGIGNGSLRSPCRSLSTPVRSCLRGWTRIFSESVSTGSHPAKKCISGPWLTWAQALTAAAM